MDILITLVNAFESRSVAAKKPIFCRFLCYSTSEWHTEAK